MIGISFELEVEIEVHEAVVVVERKEERGRPGEVLL